MGIDVYLKWSGQTKSDSKAQYTGFAVDAGHVGYLREAYHGGPYATAVLISEDWDEQPRGGFPISAAELKKRLPAAVLTAIYREHIIYGYGGNPGVVQLEGKSDGGGFDAMMKGLTRIFADMDKVQSEAAEYANPTEEQVRAVTALIEKRELPAVALAFVDFVALAERKEAETGKPCLVYVSA